MILHAVNSAQTERLTQVRALLTAYARERNYDAALGDFTTELNTLPGRYAPPAGALLLVTLQQQATGCVAFRRLDTSTCEMKRLYVLPEFRSRGIGRRLIAALLEQARTTGYQRMRLDSHPHMHAAIYLYQTFGFREIEAYNSNPTPGIRFFERTL